MDIYFHRDDDVNDFNDGDDDKLCFGFLRSCLCARFGNLGYRARLLMANKTYMTQYFVEGSKIMAV